MQSIEYCVSEEEAIALHDIRPVPNRKPTSIHVDPTEDNRWPDKLFTLLLKKDQDFEKEYKKAHWPPLQGKVLLDVNINDSTWHKKILPGASTTYSFESLIGMPACVATDDFSIKYTQGEDDVVLPTNQLGGASYVLIKPAESSYEDLFFNCENPNAGEKLTLEEYVKRQRAIMQAYDLQNNLLLKHITVIFNLLYRHDRAQFDALKYGLYTESEESIKQLIDDAKRTTPSLLKSVATNGSNAICMFPQTPDSEEDEEFANVIRLPSFEKFLEINI